MPLLLFHAADVGQTESGLLQPLGAVEAGSPSNKDQSLPAGMKELFPYRREPTSTDLGSERGSVDRRSGGNNSTPPLVKHASESIAVATAASETEGSRREAEPSSAEIPSSQPGRKGEGKGVPTDSKTPSGIGGALKLRKRDGDSNGDDNDDRSEPRKHDKNLPPAQGKAQHDTTPQIVVDGTKRDKGGGTKRDRNEGAPSVGPTTSLVVREGSKKESASPTVIHAGGGVVEGVHHSDSSHHHGRSHSKVKHARSLLAVRTAVRVLGPLTHTCALSPLLRFVF